MPTDQQPATAAAYQPCGATRQVGARGLVVVLVCTKRRGHRGEHHDERENALWHGDDR